MFAYNPTVNDTSGQILGQGMVSSAQTRADAQVKLADDIGSSLVSLAAAYGSKKGTEAKGKNFKKFMGMAGDTFGMDSTMFGDMDDYDAGMMLDSFGSWMPAMANAQLGKQRLGMQQTGQQIQQNSPYLRAATTNAQNVANEGGPGIVGATRRIGQPNP
jgi:hypothetical protein